jgi:Co/Zn/Cd efflux system component
MAMSAHIRAENPKKSLRKINKILREKYEIFHITVQIEESNDGDIDICCDLDHHNH